MAPQQPLARSAHYVVSRGGDVVQLVSTSNVAWHAGNRRVNRRSIGIEHEGFTARGGFTRAQYEASARLVAYLAARAGMPVNRRTIIGHDEVPSPDGRGRGGASGHTDPGRKWNWRGYLALVRRFAKSPERPRYTRRLPRVAALPAVRPKPRPSVVRPGAVVKGVARWDVPRVGRLWGRTAGGRRAARIVPVVGANGDLPPTLDLALDAPVSDAIALP